MEPGDLQPNIPGMNTNPRIRRLALVAVEGPHDELRRYRLARMDELALATPPYPPIAEPGIRPPVQAHGADPVPRSMEAGPGYS